MCIYCGTTNYRKIYKAHNGPIPKEVNGRTYDIHHVNGDHSNNSPDNLVAVTLQEHYDIHYAQEDWAACKLTAARLKMPPEEISRLTSLANRKRVANGTHHFLGGEISKQAAQRRVSDGTHNFLGGEIVRQRVEDGTHNFLGGEISKKTTQRRLSDGTHNFLGGEIQKQANQRRVSDGTHNFLTPWKCPHCNKSGKGYGNYARWHGVKCKSLVTVE